MFLAARISGRKLNGLRTFEKSLQRAQPLQNTMFDIPDPPNMKKVENNINIMTRNRLPPKQTLYALLPHHRPHIDAFHKFMSDVKADMPLFRGTYSKETTDFVNLKVKDMMEHLEYTNRTFSLLSEQIEKEALRTVERIMFLHEEKVTTILEEHPEWAEEIRRKLYNLEFEDPFDGTPLEEIH